MKDNMYEEDNEYEKMIENRIEQQKYEEQRRIEEERKEADRAEKISEEKYRRRLEKIIKSNEKRNGTFKSLFLDSFYIELAIYLMILVISYLFIALLGMQGELMYYELLYKLIASVFVVVAIYLLGYLAAKKRPYEQQYSSLFKMIGVLILSVIMTKIFAVCKLELFEEAFKYVVTIHKVTFSWIGKNVSAYIYMLIPLFFYFLGIRHNVVKLFKKRKKMAKMKEEEE